jgi:hypothetical protein
MARTFEPLARRLCRALYDLMPGQAAQWVSVSRAAKEINVTNRELIDGAISHAAHQGWLMVGEQPARSLMLTQRGELIATKKK